MYLLRRVSEADNAMVTRSVEEVLAECAALARKAPTEDLPAGVPSAGPPLGRPFSWAVIEGGMAASRRGRTLTRRRRMVDAI